MIQRSLFALLLAGAATLATSLAAAPPQTPGQPDPARVTAGTYQADPLHTLVGWRVNHLGFNDYLGMFGTVRGTLVLDPANLAASRVSIRVPIRKVITADPGLTGHLFKAGLSGGKPDFFGPSPADALFVSTAVTPAADGRNATIDGKLTMNGVTHPISIAATFTGAGKNPLSGKQTVGFQGTATIKRSDWGISGYIPLVGDEVKLELTAGFEKSG